MVPQEAHTLTPPHSHIWQLLNYMSQCDERVLTPKSTLYLHLFSGKRVAFCGWVDGRKLTWLELCNYQTSCCYAQTSSNYFTQRMQYLNCEPLEDMWLGNFHWIYHLSYYPKKTVKGQLLYFVWLVLCSEEDGTENNEVKLKSLHQNKKGKLWVPKTELNRSEHKLNHFNWPSEGPWDEEYNTSIQQ